MPLTNWLTECFQEDDFRKELPTNCYRRLALITLVSIFLFKIYTVILAYSKEGSACIFVDFLSIVGLVASIFLIKQYRPTKIIKFALAAYLTDITVHAVLGKTFPLFWLPTMAVIAVLFLKEREFLVYLVLLILPILGTSLKFLLSPSPLEDKKILTIAESTLLLAVTATVLTPYKLLVNRYRKYLSQIIEIDPLTKALNRRALMTKLKLYVSAGVPVSVMMLDIDNFKRINDTYGHLTGDKVLKELSEIIEKSLRSGDFVGRYGGEEFLIVLPRTNKETAFKVAERIRRKIERHRFPVPEPVTVSIGVADSREGESLEELISLADERLYRAKRSGKNRVIAA